MKWNIFVRISLKFCDWWGSAWNYVNLLSFTFDQKLEMIIWNSWCMNLLHNQASSVFHVNLRCKRNMNNMVLSLVPKFTKLQFLILRQDTPQLHDETVEKIAAHCHDLQELDLSKSFRLTDRSLHAIAHGCPNLVKLNISGCSAFSDAALGYLTGFCRKLKFLNLCGCVRAASDRALKVL